MNGMRQVQLPAELCQTLEHRFGGQFGSLDQLLMFVLEELVREDVAKMDRSEERMIEQRLRDLGYM
jgi:hypothetical protein